MPRPARSHVIYRITEPSPRDLSRLETAATVAAADLDVSFSTDGRIGVLRSGVAPEEGGRLTAALVVGASRAAHNHWVALPEPERPEYDLSMRRQVTELITVFPTKSFFEPFKTLIDGSQWILDRNQVAAALFHATAELDFDTVGQNLAGDRTGARLVALAPQLGVELTAEQIRNWRQQTGEQVLDRRPELDYRQLNDPRFANSERGRQLAQAYTYFCAAAAAKGFKSSRANTSPLLPVSKFPVFAGFLEDMLRARVPSPHSSTSREVARLVLASDCVDSQAALFEIICAPASQGPSYPFPGPSEFEVRAQLVEDVWNAYRGAGNEYHRTVLKIGLQGILEAYTSGDLAQALVTNEAKPGVLRPAASRRSPLLHARRIAGDLTSAFMGSGDHEMMTVAVRAASSPHSVIRPAIPARIIRALS
jgi:hypothetical protein